MCLEQFQAQPKWEIPIKSSELARGNVRGHIPEGHTIGIFNLSDVGIVPSVAFGIDLRGHLASYPTSGWLTPAMNVQELYFDILRMSLHL